MRTLGDLGLYAMLIKSVTQEVLERVEDSRLPPVLPAQRGREVRVAHQEEGEVQVEREAVTGIHLHQYLVTWPSLSLKH